MVICDLWLGICHAGKEGGFADIWKSDQSDISNDLQLQLYLDLNGFATRLGILWCLHGGSRIMLVAKAATSAGQNDLAFVVAGHVCNDFAGLCILDHGAFRYL